MSDETEITPIDYAYRIRSKCNKALRQAKEANAPRALLMALAHAFTLAERHVASFSEDAEPSNPVPKAPVAPVIRKAEKPSNPERLALIEELNALKRANASLKAQATSEANAGL